MKGKWTARHAQLFFILPLACAFTCFGSHGPRKIPRQGTIPQSRIVVDLPLDELRKIYPAEVGDLLPDRNQEELVFLLQKVGEKAAAFFQGFPKIISRERVRRERLRSTNRVENSVTENYYYSIYPRQTGGWEEGRTDSRGRTVEPRKVPGSSFITAGFAGLAVFFHPDHQAGSRFRYLGRQGSDGNALLIAFAQQPESANPLGFFQAVNSKELTSLFYQGIAWIDPLTYQIVRMRTDILAPRFDILLTRLTSEIRYSEVRFTATPQTFWLPQDVVVTIEWNGQLYRNRHAYSDYQVLLVEVHDQVESPQVGEKHAGEFIFVSAPFASCHASTIVELRNGDFMAAWFGGSAEGRPDVAIWGARLSGGRWTAPFELAREPHAATYNPVLFYSKDNRLWLYYKFGFSPMSWTAARLWSTDDGRNWTAVEHLPAGLYGPIRAKPLVLSDGTIVSGSSVETSQTWSCWIERSTDGGKTWSKFGPINVPRNPETSAGQNPPYGIIQPTIVPMGGRRLRFYARSTSHIGKICAADSTDNGITWTQARPIDLPNPNSAIDAVALRDGRIVLVYNHSSRSRTPLNVAVSKDGEHFQTAATLETEPDEYSYPAVIQARNGDLHITYTWKRERIRHVVIPLANIPK
jgi:predicted neuraminidase